MLRLVVGHRNPVDIKSQGRVLGIPNTGQVAPLLLREAVAAGDAEELRRRTVLVELDVRHARFGRAVTGHVEGPDTQRKLALALRCHAGTNDLAALIGIHRINPRLNRPAAAKALQTIRVPDQHFPGCTQVKGTGMRTCARVGVVRTGHAEVRMRARVVLVEVADPVVVRINQVGTGPKRVLQRLDQAIAILVVARSGILVQGREPLTDTEALRRARVMPTGFPIGSELVVLNRGATVGETVIADKLNRVVTLGRNAGTQTGHNLAQLVTAGSRIVSAARAIGNLLEFRCAHPSPEPDRVNLDLGVGSPLDLGGIRESTAVRDEDLVAVVAGVVSLEGIGGHAQGVGEVRPSGHLQCVDHVVQGLLVGGEVLDQSGRRFEGHYGNHGAFRDRFHQRVRSVLLILQRLSPHAA